MPLFLRNRDLVAQTDIDGELRGDFEVILCVPGVVGPVERGIVRVAETAAACRAQKERGEIIARVGDIRVAGAGGTETDVAPGVVVAEPAINAGKVFHAELDAVPALDPGHLLFTLVVRERESVKTVLPQVAPPAP